MSVMGMLRQVDSPGESQAPSYTPQTPRMAGERLLLAGRERRRWLELRGIRCRQKTPTINYLRVFHS